MKNHILHEVPLPPTKYGGSREDNSIKPVISGLINLRSLTFRLRSNLWMLKTGWIDPYSPVSNSNTEEMEELLRVEEEILNSPPKAEPAPKADKGDKVRLSGAARKRLAHYLAKAKVPEIEAGSTNRKAAQPPIPKPTEATGTREHRSDRFAVIAKGYPTALLSTKELVMVREAILDKIREQRQGAVKPYFTGCSLRPEEKHVELTLSVDPVSDDLLKSQGYTLCYGFGLVNVRPKNRHSVGVKDTAAEPEPGTASTTQVQEAKEEKEKAGGSTLEDLMTSAKAAKMERPATKAPQVARMRPPLYGRLPNKPGKGARRSQEETACCWAATGVRRGPLEVGEGTDGPLHPPPTHTTRGNLRLQANLHHAKAASDVLCCRFAKEDLDIAFLQEPWILSGKIKGLNTREGNLIYAYEQQRPRAALLLNKKMTFVLFSQFITEDLVAVWAKVPTASGEQEAVLASAYFPGDSSDAPPREVSALVEYCQDKRIRWIIGCDANAHHTVWEVQM
ncbi:hypothetical protein ACLKA6_002319 [Drosophila palustris]